ncbi:sensor histidine kinase [Paenibacillus cymbidii]|uniref:sensor histidine kinase n=1 Tax=Paenibacillus cymbidii TaxID=1639034 RepID=UPI0014369922|nr:histidine kinase [Paenibacillus cymbidii]
MKKTGNAWKHSIFRRLLTTFIAIMIPIYVFGLFIYNWGIHAVREEISNSMESQVSSYLSNLEDEIKRIQSSQYDALVDENLYTLAAISASLNEYDRSKAVLRLQQRLDAIKNSSSYISNVTAYIPPIGITVSALYAQEPISAPLQDMMAAPVDLQSAIHYWNGRLYMTVRYPYPSPASDTPLRYAIIVELSAAGIERALARIDQSSNSMILIDPELRFTLSGNSDRDINRSIRDEVLLREREGGDAAKPFSIRLGDEPFMVIAKQSEALHLVLTKYVREDQIFAKVNKYQSWFWAYTVITLVIISVYCVSTYKFIHKPLVKLVRSFKKIEIGDFNIQIEHSHQDEFRYLFTRFNVMASNLNTLIDQVYKQQIMAQRAELKQLQSQINPHFLYNSFFILHGMVVSEDYDTLKLFTKQLGSYFQFITRSSASDIPLQQEVAHARTYAQIQAKRFRSRMQVDFGELPEACRDVLVPRLVVQPIIENAFEHGLENKMADGLLRIRFHFEAPRLFIHVEDNGEEATPERLAAIAELLALPGEQEQREITGMINIDRRLRLKFGDNSGVSVARSELGGLRVTTTIELGEDDGYVSSADR